MSATTAGPFALHPADPGVVDEVAGSLSRFGSRAESVGSQADRIGWLAGAVESQGLFDPIRSTVQPVLDSGVMLASAGRVADLALKVWSRAVRDYNRTIDRLNTEWETAKAGSFGVGDLVVDRASMSPKAVTDAAQEHAADLADAKDALWVELRRRQHAAEERLDAIADGVAGMLSNADDPDVQLLAVSMLSDAGTETADSNDAAEYQSYNPYGSYGSVIEGAGDPSTPSWSDLGEMLAFVFGDPRACVGDDASAGACGLEVAGLIPIFKGPKWAAKIAKYFKRADNAKDHARDAKRAASQITSGHAYSKHIDEFRDLGIVSRVDFERHVESVVRSPSESRHLERGRSAYWDSDTGTVVIKDPNHPDGGTAFRPDDGYEYYDEL